MNKQTSQISQTGLIITFLFLIFKLTFGCLEGCQVCLPDNTNGGTKCDQCMDGFTFSSTLNSCITQLCEEYQFMKINNIQNPNQCLSICDQTTIGIKGQQQCQQSSSCSIKYVQSSFTSKGRVIQDVQSYKYNQILVLYSNFFNSIDAQTGSFLRSYSFQQKITLIKSMNNNVYLFSNDNQIYVWDSDHNNPIQITTAQKGIINNKSEIIKVFNSEDRLFIASFFDKDMQVILTEISTISTIQITISFEFQAIVLRNLIVLQNSNNQVKLIRIKEDSQKNIFIDEISNSYICESLLNDLNQVESNFDQSIFYLTFENLSGIRVIKYQQNTCSKFSDDEIPQKLQVHQIKPALGNSFIKLVFVSFQSNKFKIFDEDTYSEKVKLAIDSEILDFIIIQLGDYVLKVYILKSSNLIEVYTLTVDINPDQFHFLLSDTKQVLIDNPIGLVLIQNQISQTIQQQLCVISTDIQVINIDSTSSLTAGISIDYKQKTFYHEESISKLQVDDNIYFSFSCSQEGKVVVWSIVNPLQPQFYYNIVRENQSCLDILVYKSKIGVVLFTNEILLFDVFNQNQYNSVPIDPNFYSGIQVTVDYIFLYYNQKIRIMSSITNDLVISQLTESSKKIFLSNKLDIYIIDQNNRIIVYYYDSLNKVVSPKTSVTSYQSSNPIKYINLFDQDSGDVFIIFSDDTKTLIILNDKLQLAYSTIQQQGTLLQIYQLNTYQYFVLLLAPSVNKSYPYAFQYLELKNTVYTVYYHYALICQQILYVKTMNIFPGEEYYQMDFVAPISHSVLVNELIWNRSISLSTLEKFIWTPSQIFSTVITNSLKTWILSGSQTGFVGSTPYNKLRTMNKIFDIQQQSSIPNDQIKFIRYNFVIGIFFIASKTDVYCYNIFTYEFIEKLSINNTLVDNPEILEILIAEKLQIFVIYSKRQILLKDVGQNKLYTLNFSDTDQTQQYITGVVIDESIQKIFIYGYSLVQYDLTLTQSIKYSTSKQINYLQCLFYSKLAICLYDQNQILFYDREVTFLVIQTLKITSLKNFYLAGDEQNQFLYIYSNKIEAYDFSGIYKASFSDMKLNIFQFFSAGAYNVAFTASTAYIISRKDLIQVGVFNPSGATLTKGFYFSEINMIAYITNETRFGQIKFFNLDTFQALGSLTSYFTQNKVGKPIKLYYDPDHSMINYLDQYGNLQNANFGSQIYTDNMIAVPEIQKEVADEPTDYILDYNLNEVYISNPRYIWRVSYTILNKTFLQMKQINRSYQIIRNTQESNPTVNSVSMVFMDDYNNLFLYQQYKTSFLIRLDDEIQEIRGFTQKGVKISLIIFSNKVYVYNGDNPDFSNPKKIIPNFKIKQILLIQNDWVILEMIDNTIINYDFINYVNLFSFQYNQNSIISTQLSVYNPTSANYYIYFSITDGMIYKYNLSLQVCQQFSQFLNSDIVMEFIQYGDDKLVLSMKSGIIYEVDNTNLILLQTQNIYQNAQSYATSTTEAKSQNVILVKLDISLDRYFLSISEEKKMCVFKLSDNSFIKILAFPEENYKQFTFTNKYLFLRSSFQINIYNKNLQYIGYFRRSNRKCFISQIIELFDNYFIIAQQFILEIIYIDEPTHNIKAIDSITLNNPKISYFKLIDNQSTIQIIGMAEQGVFEERISVGLLTQYAKKYQQNTQTTQTITCSSQLSYTNTLQIQNDFDNIYSNQDQQEKTFFLSVLIDQTIQQMNFLEKDKVQIILRPRSNVNKLLNLSSNSFSKIGSNVQLDSFDIKFIDQKNEILFQEQTEDVSFQDAYIQQQQIMLGTSLHFKNKNKIMIQNMVIDTIDLDSQDTKSLDEQEKYSLFNFEQIKYLLIQDLTITNLNQKEGKFLLILASSVQELIIRNLTIKDSFISNDLIELNDIQTLRINTIQILNCQSLKQVDLMTHFFYVLNFNGIQKTQIHYMTAQDNNEIQLIKSNKSYKKSDIAFILQYDTFIIEKSLFKNNIYPKTFQKNYQINLIELSNTYITLNLLTYESNYSNLYVSSAKQLLISNSNFELNNGVTGASLQLQNIEDFVSIQNCNFKNNNALASGGAIYTTDVNQLKIDSVSQLKNNSALIGGAIRILITNSQLQSSLQDISQIQCQFSQNTAKLYGQNIGTYTYNANIILTESETGNVLQQLQKGNLNIIINQLILINNFQSGGNLFLHIQLLDENDHSIIIDQNLVQSNEYPILIMNELSNYAIEISALPTDKNIEVKGESLINIKQYAQTKQQFSFNNLIISSNPNSVSKSLRLSFKINDWQPAFIIQFQIQFRKCLRGEIPVQISSNIITCRECTTGTYSLVEMTSINDQSQLKKEDQSLTSCKKCPQGTLKCEKDVIVLKEGYWRENESTDVIVQCNDIKPDICIVDNNQSRQGCAKGYIGPLCETCDTYGEVWDGQGYAPAFGLYTCAECSQQQVQIFYSTALFLSVFIYIFWSIVMFLNNYIYNARCTYLRFMNLLPFSKSCILDESTFIIKSLINYLQISQVLYSISMNFVPQAISFIPSIAGQPMGKIVVSSSCIYVKIQRFFNLHEEIKIRTVVYIIVPFLFLGFFLLTLSILQKFRLFNINKYHKYVMVTILFFFFQPDSISFFTQALTCRTIGDKKYVRSSLIINCDDSSYNQFQYSAILPMLIFWIIFPLAILLIFVKDTKHSQNLQFCVNKFKYGYFYLEYKPKYYFWEFIRIFFRITIVLTITLLVQLETLSFILCIIMISFYISALHIYDPFQSNLLGKLEILANFIMIGNVFLSLMNSKYPNVVFQIFISFLHYGIISFFLVISIQMKMQDQSNPLVRCLNIVLQRCIPKQISKKWSNLHNNKLKTLMLWKKIYFNLIVIREKKVEEQILRIQTATKRSDLLSKRLTKESSLKLDNGQSQTQYNYSNQLSHTNQNTSQEKFKLQFHSKSQSKDIFLLGYQDTQQGHNDYIKEEKDTQETMKTHGFPAIDTQDFEEEVLPLGIYNSKQSKIHFQNLQ